MFKENEKYRFIFRAFVSICNFKKLHSEIYLAVQIEILN